MKTKSLFFIWIVCVSALTGLLFFSEQADGWERKPIYDGSADGSKQIADALALAKKENKRVLLQFGANWCFWCHRLHHFFETDKAVNRKLASNFVVVLADVSNDRNAAIVSQYGQIAQSGIPAISVLDAEGKMIASTGSEDFVEGGNYSSTKVLAFLNSCVSK